MVEGDNSLTELFVDLVQAETLADLPLPIEDNA
jgi:hypothetical protein